jgi:hypothetical protein
LGLHIGDIAYNLDIAPRGDDYIKGVSPMASTFPWMMGPGNHEADCNYTYQNYRARFEAQNMTRSLRGPASGSSRYYSFELGPVHFVMFDTDAYGFDEVAYMLRQQFEWLAADLAAVDRQRTPWIVLMSHRPMYCSPSSAAGAHLGWPKQPEQHQQEQDEEQEAGSHSRGGSQQQAPPPHGYGDGFAAQGLLPPAWRADDKAYHPATPGSMDGAEGPVDGVASLPPPSASIPPCGIGELVRNGTNSRLSG